LFERGGVVQLVIIIIIIICMYQMIDGQSLTEKEIFFLQNLNYDGKSIKGALQQFVASKLLSDHLSSIEEEAIK